MKDISIKRAAIINAAASYSCVILQLMFSAVLARILLPEHYGILGVMTVFTTFFAVLANMGIGTAVIQNKELDKEDISNIFTFNLYIAIAFSLMFAAFSIPLSSFYNNGEYVPIGCLLAISLFFSTMNMVPNALLMKDKKFVTIGLRMIIVTVVSSSIAIVFAWMGFKYYALAVQSIIQAFVNFLWNYSSTRIKLKLKCNFKSVKKIFTFSLYQFAFNVFNYFARNADNLLIAKFMGDTQLGYYDKAYKLALYPEQNLTNVINPVMHPILSEHQNDKQYIYDKYMSVVKILSLLGMFACIYMYFASYEIICIMFGKNWAAAIPCIQMLSISVWAQVVNSSSGAIFQSLGNTKNLFITGVMTSLCTLVGIILGIIFGDITDVARNAMFSYIINFFISYFMLIKKTFHFSFLKFLKSFLPDVGIAAMVVGAGFLASYVTIQAYDITGITINACIKLAVMGVVYIIGLVIFRQHKYIIGILKRRHNKKDKSEQTVNVS